MLSKQIAHQSKNVRIHDYFAKMYYVTPNIAKLNTFAARLFST